MRGAAAVLLAAALVLGAAGGGFARAAEGEHAAGADTEHGAEHAGRHAPALDGRKLLLQMVNFGALAFLLVWFGGRAVNKALLVRHQQLKAELVAAAEARTAAEQRLAQQEARLASLEKEISAIARAIKQEAEAEKARLIAAAEERAKRIREETAFLLEQQVKEAEIALKREVAEAAVKVAEELVRRSLDGRDQQRLLEVFVAEVAAGNGAPAASHHTDGTSGARPAPTPRSEV